MSISEALPAVDINGFDDFSGKAKSTAFLIASYLTDPICKAHEYFRRLHIVEALNPTASKVANFARKMFLWLAVAGFAFLAIFTTLPGLALRGITAYLQNKPFIYEKGLVEDKKLGADRTFSLLSWNICCVGAGYAISSAASGGNVLLAFGLQ